ncbi:MAG: cytochrome P450, partial [bacterium]
LWRPGMMGEALEPFLGKGLLTTDDETHDRARRLMEPAFRRDRLRNYTETMIEETRETVGELQTGDEVEIYDWSRKLALRIASKVLLGMDAEAELTQKLSRNFANGLETYNVPLHLQALQGPFTPRWQRKRARSAIRSLLSTEIERRRRTKNGAENILSILIEAEEDGESFSNEEIADQLFTLLFAGHDTTISTVSWMVMLLGKHRNVHEQLVDHLNANINGLPTVDDIMDGLPYLDQVLDETLRLYPAAWVGARRTREPFEVYGEVIPEDTGIAYTSAVTHRMPEYYDDPEMFDPSRFEPDRKRNRPAGAYVPFGRGPRTCIGMNFGKLEIKTIISILLTNFHLELLPGQDFTPQWMPTLTPKNGVETRIKAPNDSLISLNDNPPVDSQPEQDGNSESGNCPVTG